MTRILGRSDGDANRADWMSTAYYAARSNNEHPAILHRLNELPTTGRILEVIADPVSRCTKIRELFPSAAITVLEISPAKENADCRFQVSEGRPDAITSNGSAEGLTGSFDIIASCVSLRTWENLRGAVIALQSKLVNGGIMVLHDQRRVAWLTWLPFTTPKLRSIRASYTVEELRALLSGIPDSVVSVQPEYPFMLTVTIRARRT